MAAEVGELLPPGTSRFGMLPPNSPILPHKLAYSITYRYIDNLGKVHWFGRPNQTIPIGKGSGCLIMDHHSAFQNPFSKLAAKSATQEGLNIVTPPKHDWIMSKLLKSNIHPLLLAITICIAINAPYIIMSSFDKTFPDLLKDSTSGILYLFLIPFFVFISLQSYRLIFSCYYSFYFSKIIDDKKIVNFHIEKTSLAFSSKKTTYISYFLAIIFTFIVLYIKWYSLGTGWNFSEADDYLYMPDFLKSLCHAILNIPALSKYERTNIIITYSSMLSVPAVFFSSYIIMQYPVRIIALCYNFRSTISSKININIFHPDGYCGMGKIAKIALVFNIYLSITLLICVLAVFENLRINCIQICSWYNILISFAAIFVVYSMLFEMISPACKSIIIEKERVYNSIMASMQEEKLLDEGWEKNEKKVERIKQLIELSENVRSQPSWPLNYKSAVVFMSAPPVSMLITFVTSYIKSNFN